MNPIGVIRSWSQYKQFGECPKSFELARISKAPRRPGPWLSAGTAVHRTIERYLRQFLQEAQ